MELGAEEESADSRVCAGSPVGAVEAVGSKIFLGWHFREPCFCRVFSSLWLDSEKVKSFLRATEFVWCEEEFALERGSQRNLVLTRLI